MRRMTNNSTRRILLVAILPLASLCLAAAWRAAIARAQQHPRKRDAVAGILEAQQRRRGAPPEALAVTFVIVAEEEPLYTPRFVALGPEALTVTLAIVGEESALYTP